MKKKTSCVLGIVIGLYISLVIVLNSSFDSEPYWIPPTATLAQRINHKTISVFKLREVINDGEWSYAGWPLKAVIDGKEETWKITFNPAPLTLVQRIFRIFFCWESFPKPPIQENAFILSSKDIEKMYDPVKQKSK